MSSNRGGAGFGDDDRLPWLETVEEDYREGPSVGRILLLVVLVLAVVAAGVFGFWWYQKQQGLSGNGELIAAPAGDYKIPDNDAGQKFDGVGDVATGNDAAADGNVAMAEGPEAPVQGKTAPQATATPVTGTATASVAVPESAGTLEAKAPASAGSGALIQLGAFPDQQGADAAWQRLSGRFSQIAGLGKSIERGTANGKPVYRLRVNAGSNGQAKDICAKLSAAGERCYVAN
ncbi:SPOR domain-containing protein [Sphingomonas sp.]|uniref:SPOR domain-containing protein n=1 Tax=Sphingomonas sp. TaxID=28214 RepID=UPI001B1182F0|nr:SPOR domain-containing protein [Sphingomonas sp.]MBO9714322.1 SPOR domain-containing protein [Sphingomonas sp.]